MKPLAVTAFARCLGLARPGHALPPGATSAAVDQVPPGQDAALLLKPLAPSPEAAGRAAFSGE